MRPSFRTRALLALLAFCAVARPAAASDKVRARRSYELALEMYLNGDFKHAATEVSDAISQNSSYMPPFALRARLYEIFGDQPSMLKDADRVVTRLGDSLSTL